MTPHYTDDTVQLFHGDCLDVLRELPDASVDAVITDPPYGLSNTSSALVAETVTRWVSGEREYMPGGSGFMGKAWDRFVPPVAVWDECFRVLKPGGHLAAFAGSRTYDLMTLAVRLAGFDVRDGIAWLYGSGFPKSRNVTEAMNNYLAGDREVASSIPEDVYTVTAYLRAARDKAGWTNRRIDELFGTNGMAGHWTTSASQPAVPSVDQWARLKAELGTLGDDVDHLVERYGATERPDDWGTGERSERFLGALRKDRPFESVSGWGTALKPAFEPIVLARKPPVGSTTANVTRYGTGGLHIDACRVGDEVRVNQPGSTRPRVAMGGGWREDAEPTVAAGRWPTNVLLDPEQADELDRQAADREQGASRFFPVFRYESKAPTNERPRDGDTMHTTVKPLDLMRWLVRLITPPGGTVLEPFAGSGTTAEACVIEGFDCIAIEREAEYLPLIETRLTKEIAVALEGTW